MPTQDCSKKIYYRELDFLGAKGYRVGNDGSVWSRWKGISKGRGNGKGLLYVMGDVWKKLKPAKCGGRNRNYLFINLKVGYGKKAFYIHRLILDAFDGPCPESMQCRHLDGNPKNNHVDNLRWGTPKEDAEDKRKHGTILIGEANGNSKLFKAEVELIRKLYKMHELSQLELSNMFGVGQTTISEIIRNKRW